MKRILGIIATCTLTASLGFSGPPGTGLEAINALTGNSSKPVSITPKDLEAAQAALFASNRKLAASLQPVRKHADAVTKEIEGIKKEMAAADLDLRNSMVENYKTKTGSSKFLKNPEKVKELENLQAKLATAEAKLTTAQKSLGEASTPAEEASRDKVNVLTQLSSDKVPPETQNKALVAVLTADTLIMDFSKYKDKVGDADQALDQFSAALDKSNLGAYLKDKMGLLLNSQVMCEAYARCREKGRKEVSAENIQQTLFPGTEESTRKGNLYDKTHSNPGAQ